MDEYNCEYLFSGYNPQLSIYSHMLSHLFT